VSFKKDFAERINIYGVLYKMKKLDISYLKIVRGVLLHNSKLATHGFILIP